MFIGPAGDRLKVDFLPLFMGGGLLSLSGLRGAVFAESGSAHSFRHSRNEEANRVADFSGSNHGLFTGGKGGNLFQGAIGLQGPAGN